jgi:hypothetical protein
VAGALGFHNVALGVASQRSRLGLMARTFPATNIQLVCFSTQAWCDSFETARKVRYLRPRHERGPLRRQVGCKELMKLRGVEVREAVCALHYCARFAEVTWKAFSVACLVLSSVGHVSRDAHQSGNGWVRSCFRNFGAPVAAPDARSILLGKDALGGGRIFFKGRLRFLDDADVISVRDQDVINAFPARTIRPRAMN